MSTINFQHPINTQVVVSSLETISLGEVFEDFMQSIFTRKYGEDYLPIGGSKDGGRDGRIFESGRGKHLLQFSIEGREKKKFSGKVTKTIEAMEKTYGPDVLKTFRISIYFSYKISSGEAQKMIDDLIEKKGLTVHIRGAEEVSHLINESPETRETFWNYINSKGILRSLEIEPTAFTRMEGMDSTLVYLSQFMDRTSNDESFIELIVRNYMCLCLKDIDPSRGVEHLASYDDVVDYVCKHSPFIARERAIAAMLKILTREKTLHQSRREFRNYEKEKKLCLSYEARLEVASVAAETKKKEELFLQSIMCRLPSDMDENEKSEVAYYTIRCLAKTYCDFGIEMIGHIQKIDSSPAHESLQSIVQQVCDKIDDVYKARRFCKVLPEILYQLIWRPTPDEKEYCTLMSRSYSLLFVSKGDQSVIQYLESSARGLMFILGTDLIVKIFSEAHLTHQHQRYTNMVRSLRESGISFFVTDKIVTEAAMHIKNTVEWYEENIGVILKDPNPNETTLLVQDYLERTCPRILVRAFYHARKDGKAKDFNKFIVEFVSANKALYKESILAYFEASLGVKLAATQIEASVVDDIAARLLPHVRSRGNENQKAILARNDASTVASIYSMRNTNPNHLKGSLFRHRVWWLTEETKIGRIRKYLNEAHGEDPYIHPEVACSLLANLPYLKSQAKQLHSVLSSAVGLQLSRTIDDEAVKVVLESYEEIKSLSPGSKAVRMNEILHTITTNSLSKDVFFLSEVFSSKLEADTTIRTLKKIDRSRISVIWNEIGSTTQDPICKVVIFCLALDMDATAALVKLKDKGMADEIKGITSKMIEWVLDKDKSFE